MVGFNKAMVAVLAFGAMALTTRPITVHLAGDSTMAEKKSNKRPQTGWGEMLQQYFPAEDVVVANYAKNGASTRTFIGQGLWQKLIDSVKPGDFVFIEFAHNDEVPSKTDRYTPPDQYRANLVRFVNETRAKQGTAVLLTPVSRRKFAKDGTVVDSHHEYSEIVRAVAKELRVPLIDMDRKSALVVARHGVEGSKKLFLQLGQGENANYQQGVHDDTHFSPLGAQAMARLAVDGIREQQLTLAKYLKDDAWQQYLTRSDSVRAADSSALAAELRIAGRTSWTPAPTDQGFFMQDSMTAVWFATPAARGLARNIVSYQAPNGGWSKRMAFTHVRRPGEAFTSAENETWFSTFDNGATFEELRFLGEAIKAQDDAALRNSFLRGLDYVLIAQQPAGCWPQIFPLAGSYHNALTFNDDLTVNALRLLRDVANGTYAFVPTATRVRAGTAARRGLDCIVATQVTEQGRKTGWAAQHDEFTLLPIKARAYEHASLSGREGAAIVRFLMELPDPSAAAVHAVHEAADWFKRSAITGYTYEYKGDLTAREGAGPFWARFYELNTNRPIFSDRDGVIRYHLSEIGSERRYGYGWYTDEPIGMLKRYEKWAKTHPRVQK